MLLSSFRIYITANVLIYCLFSVWFFPHGFGIGIIAMLFSLLLSLPALLLLILCFWAIEEYRPKLAACWLLLLVAVAVCVWIPTVCFTAADELNTNHTLFCFSTGAGFGAVVFQAIYLHNYFKSLQHENN